MARYLVFTLVLGAVLAGAGCGDNSAGDPSEPGLAFTWYGVKGQRGFNGEGVHRSEAWSYFVEDLTFGPDGLAYIADWNNHRVRRLDFSDRVHTIIGTDYEGDGPPGEIDRLPFGNPEGAEGTRVALNHPTDIAFLSDGTLVLAAWHNNKIRVWEPDTGRVTVIAGDSYGFDGDQLPAYEAVFNQPKSVVVDNQDRIYLNDQRNQRIRLIDAGEPRMITTIAGTGVKGYSGDGGLALEATFSFDAGVTPLPSGSLVLHDGFLFIADSLNHRIRRIDLATGMIECIAGIGERGYSGDGGPAIEAALNQPLDIEIGPDGLLYVADTFNNAIRTIDLDTGIIETVAGNGQACANPIGCFEAEDVVEALELQLSAPYGIAFDPAGDLHIADTNNSRIVKVLQ